MLHFSKLLALKHSILSEKNKSNKFTYIIIIIIKEFCGAL